MDERLRPERFWPRLVAALEQVPADARVPPAKARAGAVLVLLEETDAGPQVVLTRRRRDLRSHPGQVSFPGGRLDAGETVEQAALREAYEEIGLRPDSVEVVGTGPAFYIPPSRFWVVPVLGRWHRPHPLTENPWEVDQVLHVPLSQLLDAERWRHAPLSLKGSTWAWQLEDDLLWGATAVVLSLLLDVAVDGWHGGIRPEALGEPRAVRPWEDAPAWVRRPRLEGDLPAIEQASVTHVGTAEIRALRAWLDQRGLGPVVRAEQAGRAVAQAVRRLCGGELTDLTVTVMAGGSTNGTAGLAAARLLAAAGARLEVVTVGAARVAEQVQLLVELGVAVTALPDDGLPDEVSPGEVVIDAMLGVGAEPPLRELPERAARWLQRHDVPVVAVELPTGLSADTGLRGPSVTADVTVALGLPTHGLAASIVHPYVGDLYLADIGVPPAAWRAVGVDARPSTLFARGPLVRLTAAAHATDAGTPDQGEVAG